jgi:hypothetical protein
MKRREFMIRVVGASAWLLPWTRSAHSQNPAQADQVVAGQIGQVDTLQGSATVIRAKTTTAVTLRVNDPIFKNDTLATAANSTLGVTFDDQTTFSLSANTRIVVNEFVYAEGGAANAAVFNVAAGTAAFVAALVARTGEMKITTPVATLGIRGTTGVIDVPEQGGVAAPGGVLEEPRIKLYADADGYVGQIEVFNPQGGSLGALTLGASAFVFRRGAGGRLEAVPYPIPPQEAARDRGVLRRLFAAHNIGRRKTNERLRKQHQQRNNPRRLGPPHDRNPHPPPRNRGRNQRN